MRDSGYKDIECADFIAINPLRLATPFLSDPVCRRFLYEFGYLPDLYRKVIFASSEISKLEAPINMASISSPFDPVLEQHLGSLDQDEINFYYWLFYDVELAYKYWAIVTFNTTHFCRPSLVSPSRHLTRPCQALGSSVTLLIALSFASRSLRQDSTLY